MEKTTVLVLQKVQCKGYSNNLVPLTQAGADREPPSSCQVTSEQTGAVGQQPLLLRFQSFLPEG